MQHLYFKFENHVSFSPISQTKNQLEIQEILSQKIVFRKL